MQRSAIIAVLIMSSLTIGAIVGLEVLHPGDNSIAIGHVLTISVPTTTALLGLLRSNANAEKIRAIHVDINGRLDQLVTAEKAVSHAEGAAAEREKRGSGLV